MAVENEGGFYSETLNINKPNFETDLLEQYGPLISPRDLWHVLGYPSHMAYRKVIQKGALPVVVFHIEKRKGRFAFSKDVASWLSTLWEENRSNIGE